MRSPFIYILLFSIICLCPVITFAAEDANSTAAEDVNSTVAEDPNSTAIEKTDPNTPADPNAPADPNTPVDPNAPIDVNMPVEPDAPADSNETVDPNDPAFKDLNKFLNKFERESSKDVRDWTKGDIQKNRKRLQSAQKETEKVSEILMDIAQQENAVKTIAAIDRLNKAKDQRFKEIFDALKEAEEKERARKKKADPRRGKKRSRERDRSTR